MSNVNMEGLPPEMQQRIAGIIEEAKATAAATETKQHLPKNCSPTCYRQPSLMDHLPLLLRQVVVASASRTRG